MSPVKRPRKDSFNFLPLPQEKLLSSQKESAIKTPSPDRNLNKSFNAQAPMKKIIKIRSKNLKNEISDILEYFSELIKIETKFGEMISVLGNPKFFNLSIIFIEDKLEKAYKLTDLEEDSMRILTGFLNDKNMKKFSLPEWNVFREGMKILGQTHKDCAIFIKNGVNDMAFMFNHEYLTESLKIKKEKKELKILFEKSVRNLAKISKEYKELHETYKKLTEGLEEARNRKVPPPMLMKKENKIKMAIYQLGIFFRFF